MKTKMLYESPRVDVHSIDAADIVTLSINSGTGVIENTEWKRPTLPTENQ